MIDEYIFDKDYLLYLKNKVNREKYVKLYKNIFNIINSEQYNDLLYEYNFFVKNISKLFKELNIINPIEVALLYNKLLFEGVFSIDYKFTLCDTTKLDLLVKTWGSRVCTGNSVCRHNSLLLVDIERELNNIVECVDLVSINPKNFCKNIMAKYLDLINVNHLAVGIKENDSIYLYDPTNYVFLFNINYSNKGIISFIDYDEKLNRVNNLRNYFNSNNNNNNLDYSQVFYNLYFNNDYINDISSKIEDLFNNNLSLISEFHLDCSKKIRKLSYLNDEIIYRQNHF